MGEKYGIQETKDLVAAFMGLASAAGEAIGDDGRVDLSDIGTLMAPAMSIPAAVTGIEKVPAEIKDLDAEERAELLEYAKEKFDIPQDALEARVERALKLGLEMFELVNDFRKGS